MNIRCENCGQLSLETDKLCWHCGRPLAGRDIEEPEKVAVNQGWQQTQSWGAISGYVAVAVFVILAAILVTRILGQQPRVSANVGDRAPEGWEAVMDSNSRFTFYLPQAWTWFGPERRERRPDPPLSYLLETGPVFTLGTNPFGGETDDLEIDFLAVPISDTAAFEDESSLIEALITADAFMLVGRSQRLNDLAYEETVQFLLNSDYRILEARQQEELDRSYLTIFVETPVEAADDFEFLRCNQQFFLGRTESMLVTLCAKNTVYTSYQRTFSDILTSFRRLF
jgi:hypothetical protein